MNRAKLKVLEQEFPFLREVKNLTGFNPIEGDIKVSRLDRDFLISVPVTESYRCSAGNSETYDRLFSVVGDQVVEIDLIRSKDHSTGYAYDVSQKSEGDTYLSALIAAGCREPNYLVWHHFQTCQYYDGREEDRLTIFKPMKGSNITLQWAEVLRDAEQELKKQFNSIDDTNAKLAEIISK